MAMSHVLSALGRVEEGAAVFIVVSWRTEERRTKNGERQDGE
jgi:hypothetical protein